VFVVEVCPKPKLVVLAWKLEPKRGVVWFVVPKAPVPKADDVVAGTPKPVVVPNPEVAGLTPNRLVPGVLVVEVCPNAKAGVDVVFRLNVGLFWVNMLLCKIKNKFNKFRNVYIKRN
jgi:hypothetical protein